MGIDEIDLTIYPYTVGREDCRVLPRSFQTLAEAEAYLAKQDQGARERGDFYLDGPESDSIEYGDTDTPDPLVGVAAPPVAEGGQVHSECTPMAIQSEMTRHAWKREVEELCRALEASERAQ